MTEAANEGAYTEAFDSQKVEYQEPVLCETAFEEAEAEGDPALETVEMTAPAVLEEVGVNPEPEAFEELEEDVSSESEQPVIETRFPYDEDLFPGQGKMIEVLGKPCRRVDDEASGLTYIIQDIEEEYSSSEELVFQKANVKWRDEDVVFIVRYHYIEKEAEEPETPETPETPEEVDSWKVIYSIPKKKIKTSPKFYSEQRAIDWAKENGMGEFDINESYDVLGRFNIIRKVYTSYEEASRYLEQRKVELGLASAGEVAELNNGIIHFEAGGLFNRITLSEDGWTEVPTYQKIPTFFSDRMLTNEIEEYKKLDQQIADYLCVDAKNIYVYRINDEKSGTVLRTYHYFKDNQEYNFTFAEKKNYETDKTTVTLNPVKMMIRDENQGYGTKYNVYEFLKVKKYQAVVSGHAEPSVEIVEEFKANGINYTAKDGTSVLIYRNPQDSKSCIDENGNYYEISWNQNGSNRVKAVGEDGKEYFGVLK